jgi:hypothetical protein
VRNEEFATCCVRFERLRFPDNQVDRSIGLRLRRMQNPDHRATPLETLAALNYPDAPSLARKRLPDRSKHHVDDVGIFKTERSSYRVELHLRIVAIDPFGEFCASLRGKHSAWAKRWVQLDLLMRLEVLANLASSVLLEHDLRVGADTDYSKPHDRLVEPDRCLEHRLAAMFAEPNRLTVENAHSRL